MPEPDYGVSLSAPTKSIKPKEKTAAAKKASQPKAAAPQSFMDKLKASITGPPVENKVTSYSHPTDNDDSGASAMQAGIASLGGATAGAGTADADMYAENLKRYNDYMESQGQPVGGPMGGKGGPRTMPQQPEITPEMRQAALGMFESQQGAGQVPYYMAAARNADNPNMSPAFQYAAQNYDVLGGSQRLAPRPMEMMSVAERNRINDMSQAMADQAAQQQMAQNEYQQGMNAMTSGKGNAATMAQPGVPPTQPPMPQPQYGGGGLAALLAKRFGPMGGSGGFGF